MTQFILHFDSDLTEHEASDESVEDVLSDHHTGRGEVHCLNCKRRRIDSLPDDHYCQVHLAEVGEEELRDNYPQLKFCHIQKRVAQSYIRRGVSIFLCQHCVRYLTLTKEDADHAKHQWPAFLWSAVRAAAESGSPDIVLSVYRALPFLWRQWWTDAVLPDAFVELTEIVTTSSAPVVQDMTENRTILQKELKQLTLGSLIKAVDGTLIPTVLCPWGCSEYCHKAGSAGLDVFF